MGWTDRNPYFFHRKNLPIFVSFSIYFWLQCPYFYASAPPQSAPFWSWKMQSQFFPAAMGIVMSPLGGFHLFVIQKWGIRRLCSIQVVSELWTLSVSTIQGPDSIEKFWLEFWLEKWVEIPFGFWDMSKLLMSSFFTSVILAWIWDWKMAWILAWDVFLNWIRGTICHKGSENI